MNLQIYTWIYKVKQECCSTMLALPRSPTVPHSCFSHLPHSSLYLILFLSSSLRSSSQVLLWPLTRRWPPLVSLVKFLSWWQEWRYLDVNTGHWLVFIITDSIYLFGELVSKWSFTEFLQEAWLKIFWPHLTSPYFLCKHHPFSKIRLYYKRTVTRKLLHQLGKYWRCYQAASWHY